MQNHRAPPYPPDTNVSALSIELDLTRVMQSKTWLLASPVLRPWLLMVWCMSWHNRPSASYDNDDEIIAARIGMATADFEQHRVTLMRGWFPANDGRLYHPVLGEQIVRHLANRERWKRNKQKTSSLSFSGESLETLERSPDGVGVGVGFKPNTTTEKGRSGGGEHFTLAPSSLAPALAPTNGSKLTTKPRPDLRGSRMQPNAQIPDEWLRWTTACYPTLKPPQVVLLFVEFRNYWSDIPGLKGLKLRWFQTWQNNIHRRMTHA